MRFFCICFNSSPVCRVRARWMADNGRYDVSSAYGLWFHLGCRFWGSSLKYFDGAFILDYRFRENHLGNISNGGFV